MGGGFNTSSWNTATWNGPGTSGFILPAEIICIEAEVINLIEIEGEVPVCDED
jgi:hypothetical protein